MHRCRRGRGPDPAGHHYRHGRCQPRRRNLPRRHAGSGGLLLPAHPHHRPVCRLDPDAGGNLWPRAGFHDLPHPGRGGGSGQQHPLRPCRLGLDRECEPCAGCGAEAEGRRRLGECDQPLRCRSRLWRYARVGLWPRRRLGRASGLSQTGQHGESAETRIGSSRPARPGSSGSGPHRQALHRRQAGPARRRLFESRLVGTRQTAGSCRHRQPQGHPQRGRGRPCRQRLGQNHRPCPGADPVLHR